MQVVCVEDQAEEEAWGLDREYVEECPACSKRMVQSHFDYGIHPALPDYLARKNASFCVVEN